MPVRAPLSTPSDCVRGGLRETLAIALPLLAASATMALNQIADRMFLASAGDAALEAVLPAGMLSATFSLVMSAVLGYSATFVAQCYGAGDARRATAAFVQGLYLFLISIPLFVLAVPAGERLLGMACCDPVLLQAERTYYRLSQTAGILSTLGVVLGGLLTGQGRTKSVGACSILGAFANIAFDRLLIFGLGPVPALGITGAGMASIASKAVVCLALACLVLRDPLWRAPNGLGAIAPDLRLAGRILWFGLPYGTCTLVDAGVFTCFTFATGALDGLSLAASNVVFAIANACYRAAAAIGDAISVLTGRYRGAQDDQAVHRSYRSGLLLSLGCAAVFGLATIPFNGFWSALFIGAKSGFDPQAFSRQCLVLLSVALAREVAEVTLLATMGALRGVGDTKFIMYLKAGVDLFVWAPAIYVLTRLGATLVELWLTMPVCMGLASALLYLRWRGAHWSRIRRFSEA